MFIVSAEQFVLNSVASNFKPPDASNGCEGTGMLSHLWNHFSSLKALYLNSIVSNIPMFIMMKATELIEMVQNLLLML